MGLDQLCPRVSVDDRRHCGATHDGAIRLRWRECTPALAAGLTDHVWTFREQKTLRLPRCLRRGGMSDLGSGLDARCQDQLEGLQWRHGPPTHTPCRLRYPVPLGLVAQVPARRVARRDTTTGAGALCRYGGAV